MLAVGVERDDVLGAPVERVAHTGLRCGASSEVDGMTQDNGTGRQERLHWCRRSNNRRQPRCARNWPARRKQRGRSPRLRCTLVLLPTVSRTRSSREPSCDAHARQPTTCRADQRRHDRALAGLLCGTHCRAGMKDPGKQEQCQGCPPASTLKDLPSAWKNTVRFAAFARRGVMKSTRVLNFKRPDCDRCGHYSF